MKCSHILLTYPNPPAEKKEKRKVNYLNAKAPHWSADDGLHERKERYKAEKGRRKNTSKRKEKKRLEQEKEKRKRERNDKKIWLRENQAEDRKGSSS